MSLVKQVVLTEAVDAEVEAQKKSLEHARYGARVTYSEALRHLIMIGAASQRREMEDA